jgi:beta-galactosidase
LSTDDPFSFSGEYLLHLKQEAQPIVAGALRSGGTTSQGETLAFTNYYLTRNGCPTLPVMGEFHYSRFPRQYWELELRKMRAGGVTIVSTYVFWSHVEEEEGIFDWSGNNDLRAFLEACQTVNIPVLLRIGPFSHGECRNGGLPDWLYGRVISVRSNDERYLSYVRRLFGQIAQQVRGLLFDEGGVVMGIQLENEYMHGGAPWEVPFRVGTEYVPSGEEGDAHMLKLKQLAVEAGLLVPLYTCTGWIGSPVPEGEFLPVQGGYAFTPWNLDPNYRQEPTLEFLFRDRHLQPLPNGEVSYNAEQYPYVCCELGGGIQMTYYHRPTVPPECVQALAVVALGSGANWLGYYMYHGGSNPVGKHCYLNEHTVPRISYDFQAPLREFGQINASFHRLRLLHLFLQDFGELLAPMKVSLPERSAQITPEDTNSLRYAARARDGSGFLFLNNYQDHVALPDRTGVRIRLDLPDESIILPRLPQGFTLCQGVSAIFPLNLCFEERVLLKYATAQLLTKLFAAEQMTYVFFALEGVTAEFAFDRATYRSIEVTGGSLLEQAAWGYVSAETGQTCSIDIIASDNTPIRFLVLTQEQALACWKTQIWGQERLILSNALVLSQENELHLFWKGQEEVNLALYPALREDLTSSAGDLFGECTGLFTSYRIVVPEHRVVLDIERQSSNVLRIGIPATALQGVEDVFLDIDYLGDVGSAYLDGRLVSDHFANGLTWEIGLKRFVHPGQECELVLRISPLQCHSTVLRYFPTGMTFRPLLDDANGSEIHTVTAILEYHIFLAQR